MRWVCRCGGGWDRQQLCCTGVTAGSSETGKGSSWSQPALFAAQELTQLMSTTHPFIPLPLLVALLTPAEVFEGTARAEPAAASAGQRGSAGPSPPVTGTGVMEAGPRFLNCPLLLFSSSPDHVFRVASSLWKQHKTDQVQLLLALLPVFPLVLNCTPEHSLQVWGCCCICRQCTWPWCCGLFWSCTNV